MANNETGDIDISQTLGQLHSIIGSAHALNFPLFDQVFILLLYLFNKDTSNQHIRSLTEAVASLFRKVDTRGFFYGGVNGGGVNDGDNDNIPESVNLTLEDSKSSHNAVYSIRNSSRHQAIIKSKSEILANSPPNSGQNSKQGISDNSIYMKRLTFIGESITLLLKSLKLSSCTFDEDISYVSTSLTTLCQIFSFMNPNDLSQVLPGVVSHIVNFTTNLQIYFKILIQLIQLLKLILTKVFNDEDLKFTISTNSFDFSDWNDLLNDKKDNSIEPPSIKFELNNKVRTKSWLIATSSQLKISLIIFFKNLLINNNNRLKIKSKPQLGNEIILFVQAITNKCFISLHKDFLPFSIDILALYLSINEINTSDQIIELVPIFILFYDDSEFKISKQNLIYKLTSTKILDLIENKLPTILSSPNDDKINTALESIKLQLKIIDSLSKSLNKDSSMIIMLQIKLFQTLQSNLKLSITMPSKTVQSMKKLVINNDSSNKLDDIELPLYINANQIANISNTPSVAGDVIFNSNLVNFSNNLQRDMTSDLDIPLFFANSYTSAVERKFIDLITFVSTNLSTESDIDRLLIIESVLGDGSINEVSTGLYIANNYSNEVETFKINDFLDLGDANETSEVSFLLLSKSLELMDEAKSQMKDYDVLGQSQQSLEFAYSIALDTIGNICKTLPLEDFQTDFMIDYLLPLLEALTFNSHSMIQKHAIGAVTKIVDQYYQGSFETLLVDNLDYLIDSINLKLSASDLTPTLPGILLVIIRFAGIKLLLTNQLIDIMNQMFITVDKFHGYSKMVEGYFVVFDELTRQIRNEYHVLGIENNSESPYRPWGLRNIEELSRLLEDNQKMVEYEDFDPNKEYFTPENADSDDEDDEEDEGSVEPTADEVWTSIVPENTYNLALTIFKYGFKLLSQQETSLKVQILKTITNVYDVLCSNYKVLSVEVANCYPVLISLISGTISLSTSLVTSIESENMIAPALELVMRIIKEDDSPERKNFSRQFIDTWSFLSEHSILFKKRVIKKSSNEKSVIRNINPKLGRLYSQYILQGINCYNKTIPDLTKIEMVRFCIQQGIPDIDVCQEVKNIMWVLKVHQI